MADSTEPEKTAGVQLGAPDGTPTTFPPGYPALAHKMGQYPQFGIVRGFHGLMARDLLYYQAELKHLERQLFSQEWADHKEQYGEEYSGDWKELSSAPPPIDQQWQKWLDIRKKLKEYYEALVLATRVACMQKPSSFDLEYIQHYMQTSEMGPEQLFGLDSSTWGSTHYPKNSAPDLITIKPRTKQDTFSNWFVSQGMSFFFVCVRPLKKRFLKPSKELMFQQNSLLKITHFISCTVAAVPPVLAVVVLSYVSTFRWQLGLLAVFNFVLAICLSGFADASRAEVFAVMAAFDAIPVVFIASNQSSCGRVGAAGSAGCSPGK